MTQRYSINLWTDRILQEKVFCNLSLSLYISYDEDEYENNSKMTYIRGDTIRIFHLIYTNFELFWNLFSSWTLSKSKWHLTILNTAEGDLLTTDKFFKLNRNNVNNGARRCPILLIILAYCLNHENVCSAHWVFTLFNTIS